MIKRRIFPKIFFGWWTVLAGGLVDFWGLGYYAYGFSTLFKPIALELGFSRAVISVGASMGRLEGGFEAPVVGWVTDRFGPRRVMTFGVFVIGLGLILMNFINSLWAFYVVWGVIAGTGVNIALSLPVDKAISNWFVKKRGLALGIRWVFPGVCGFVVLPLMAWLITTQGWRMTCVIGGLVMWFAGLPLAWFLVKQYRPEYYGLLPDGATAEADLEEDTSRMIDRGVKYAAEVQEVEFTLRQAMRTPAYWLIIISRAGPAMILPALTIHTVPFLTDMGIDPVRAAVIMGTMTLASMPGMFIGGFVGDRIRMDHLRFLAGGTFLLEAVGIATFLLNQTLAMVYVWFILFYFGFGVSVPLYAVMQGRYFGRKAFGSIRGTSMMFLAPFGFIAPVYAGWMYDTTGSYITAFTLFAVLLVLSTVIMSFASPPKPPAQVTDVRQFI